MSSPIITFRLTPNQIARGLQIIRNLEPNYQPTSISKIVKVIYLDYLAKMTINKTSQVSQELLDEIDSLINKKKNPISNFEEFKKVIKTKDSDNQNISDNPKIEEKSTITSVDDFSPPEDWKGA